MSITPQGAHDNCMCVPGPRLKRAMYTSPAALLTGRHTSHRAVAAAVTRGPTARSEPRQHGTGVGVGVSRLLAPTRLETTPEELEKALEEHETIVISLVATP